MSVLLLWILCLALAVVTGWLAFSNTNASTPVHAAFLLSVAAFVVCTVWAMGRLLSTTEDYPGKSDTDRHDKPR